MWTNEFNVLTNGYRLFIWSLKSQNNLLEIKKKSARGTSMEGILPRPNVDHSTARHGNIGRTMHE